MLQKVSFGPTSILPLSRAHAVGKSMLAVRFLFAFLGCLGPSSAFAQPIEETVDYSRAELFSILRNSVPGGDIFALPKNFKFPDNARSKSTFGVDFSHHVEDACRCQVNWSSIAQQKVAFVYLKLTQGRSFTDPSASRNIRLLREDGRLMTGVFHFFTSSDDPSQQINHFMSVYQTLGPLQLPVTLDLEWDPIAMRDDCPTDAIIVIRKQNGDVTRKCDSWGFVPSRDIIARVNKWLDVVRAATQRTPMLYTSAAWFNPRAGRGGQITDINTDLIWVADYSKGGLGTETPGVPTGGKWDLWQFTDGAAFSADANLTMDASIFEETPESMRKRLGVENGK